MPTSPGATSIWDGMHERGRRLAAGRRDAHRRRQLRRRSPTSPSWCSARTRTPSSRATSSAAVPAGSKHATSTLMKKLQDETIPVVRILVRSSAVGEPASSMLADAFVAAWLPGLRAAASPTCSSARPTAGRRTTSRGKLLVLVAASVADGRSAPTRQGPLRSAVPVRLRPDVTRLPRSSRRSPKYPGVPRSLMSTGSYFDKGLPVQPWSLRVSNGSDTTRITTVPAEVVGGRVTVTAVDDTVQEGGRRFAFDGSGKAACRSAAKVPSIVRARRTATSCC